MSMGFGKVPREEVREIDQRVMSVIWLLSK